MKEWQRGAVVNWPQAQFLTLIHLCGLQRGGEGVGNEGEWWNWAKGSGEEGLLVSVSLSKLILIGNKLNSFSTSWVCFVPDNNWWVISLSLSHTRFSVLLSPSCTVEVEWEGDTWHPAKVSPTQSLHLTDNPEAHSGWFQSCSSIPLQKYSSLHLCSAPWLPACIYNNMTEDTRTTTAAKS